MDLNNMVEHKVLVDRDTDNRLNSGELVWQNGIRDARRKTYWPHQPIPSDDPITDNSDNRFHMVAEQAVQQPCSSSTSTLWTTVGETIAPILAKEILNGIINITSFVCNEYVKPFIIRKHQERIERNTQHKMEQRANIDPQNSSTVQTESTEYDVSQDAPNGHCVFLEFPTSSVMA